MRTIDADALKDRFREDQYFGYVLKYILELIDKAPTIPAQENIVGFGRWKKLPGGMSPGGTPSYVCDSCGGTEHLYGAEYPAKKLMCKECGRINVYPWERIDWS